jgi:hypothetical protein
MKKLQVNAIFTVFSIFLTKCFAHFCTTWVPTFAPRQTEEINGIQQQFVEELVMFLWSSTHHGRGKVQLIPPFYR